MKSLPKEFEQLTNLKLLELKNNEFSETEKQKIKAWLKKELPNCEVIF